MENRLEEELDLLLSENLQQVKFREKTTFDSMVATSEPIIIYGAGLIGRKLLHNLKQDGFYVAGFMDQDESKWGSVISDIPILSFQEAADQYGNSAVFVVALWSGGISFLEIREKLQSLNCRNVISVLSLFWKYSDDFLPNFTLDLPHKIIENASKVKETFRLLQERQSREAYLSLIKFQLHDNHNDLTLTKGPQYFPNDLFSFSNEEVFVDCGAFIGDTISSFIEASNGKFQKVISFEPDDENVKKVEDYVGILEEEIRKKIKVNEYAVWSRNERLNFNSSGDYGSHIEDAVVRGLVSQTPFVNTKSVQAISLDQFIAYEAPSFIKYDIEGGELEALNGTKNIIQKHLPVLAVCIYHKQNDLWDIPLYIASIEKSYTYFIRTYGFEGWETVLYAIPKNRLE